MRGDELALLSSAEYTRPQCKRREGFELTMFLVLKFRCLAADKALNPFVIKFGTSISEYSHNRGTFTKFESHCYDIS